MEQIKHIKACNSSERYDGLAGEWILQGLELQGVAWTV